MAFHTICSKCDRALVAYLIGLDVGTTDNIFPAKRSLDKGINTVVCWSHTASPADSAFPYSGNYAVEAFVEVRTSGVVEETQSDVQPRQDADTLVGDVFDAFFTAADQQSGDSLATAITQAARSAGDADLQNFTAYSVKVVGQSQGFNPRTVIEQGNAWVDSIHLQITCCPSNID